MVSGPQSQQPGVMVFTEVGNTALAIYSYWQDPGCLWIIKAAITSISVNNLDYGVIMVAPKTTTFPVGSEEFTFNDFPYEKRFATFSYYYSVTNWYIGGGLPSM